MPVFCCNLFTHHLCMIPLISFQMLINLSLSFLLFLVSLIHYPFKSYCCSCTYGRTPQHSSFSTNGVVQMFQIMLEIYFPMLQLYLFILSLSVELFLGSGRDVYQLPLSCWSFCHLLTSIMTLINYFILFSYFITLINYFIYLR